MRWNVKSLFSKNEKKYQEKEKSFTRNRLFINTIIGKRLTKKQRYLDNMFNNLQKNCALLIKNRQKQLSS